jgi:phosphoribosylformylglycinamidine synthase subunit PurSL
MVHQIEIGFKTTNTRVDILKQSLASLGLRINNLWSTDVYTFDKKFTLRQLKKIALMLTNPVVQKHAIDKRLNPIKFNISCEVGYLPGVTDNIAYTVQQCIEDLLKIKLGTGQVVYSSNRFYLDANLSDDDLGLLSSFLINPLIQRIDYQKNHNFKESKGFRIKVPRVRLDTDLKVTEVNLNISNSKLKILGKRGILNSDGTRRGPLALNLVYMKAIKDYFKTQKRNPADIELESIAQT